MASAGVQLVQSAMYTVSHIQTELVVIVIAACLHTVFFRKGRIVLPLSTKLKLGSGGSDKIRQGMDDKGMRGCINNADRDNLLALKTALSTSDLEAALEHLRSLISASLPCSMYEGSLQTLMRLAADRGQLSGSLQQELRESCLLKSTCLYNTFIDACVHCRDLKTAELILIQATNANMADVVTYNTIVKARLQNGDIQGARGALSSMRAVGLSPNSVTFNELIDAMLEKDFDGAWALLDEMEGSGVKPNCITWSILLKSVRMGTKKRCVDRILSALDTMGDEMDEVLLSSVLEACIRINRGDFIARQLNRLGTTSQTRAKGQQTYGSIIRACGFIQDVAGAREIWQEMQKHRILPTSVTLGCMVEAISANGDPEGGHRIIRQMLGDAETHSLVNAVNYCSVLKGFSRQKRFSDVLSVHREMIEEGLQNQFTRVTYNTLIDACARCGEVNRAVGLLQDMETSGIAPNLVTYSAILKGYCQENKLDRAFELLDTMKKTPHLQPDELVYNELLDGCARQSLYGRGMEFFKEMQDAGVRPSNFTLSVLVKLACRGKHLDEAFSLCEELSRKFNIRLNVHVYSNLVQGCFMQSNRDVSRAVGVLEKMVRDGVRPDVRTYTLVLRGCITSGKPQDATGLLRAATGLSGVHPRLTGLESIAALPRPTPLSMDVISEILAGIARTSSDPTLAAQLAEDLKLIPGFRADAKLSMKLKAPIGRAK